MTEIQPRKIVVIDDDADMSALVTTILKTAGYLVAATPDPKRAHALVLDEAPDLILCDITMPEMDGYAVLRVLQADPRTAHHPVIFLTAHRDFTERVQAFRFGVVDYITKPFSRDMFLQRVERVLSGLGRRDGTLETEGDDAAGRLLAEVQREARTGVLTAKGESGEVRMVLRAGAVVERTEGDLPVDAASRAEFQELDLAHEEIVAHDPSSLPVTEDPPPNLASVPEFLRTALVVDDNPFFRRFLSEVLKVHGFTVYEAADGAQALTVALEKRPWLIVTDVMMPGMDGFELCRQVRDHALIRETPLIFLSGWDDYKERYRGLAAGADDFVSKKTPVRELLLRLQLVLARYTGLGRGGRAGIEGQIAVVGAPALLQMCHLSRLTGRLRVHDGDRRMDIRFRAGEIIGADSEGSHGEAAVLEFLAWDRGRFEFAASDPGEGSPLGDSVEQLVLEGCRRIDEERRDRGDAPA